MNTGRTQQHPDRREAFRSGEHGEDDGRQREDEPEHQTRRDEELNGIVEIEAEAIVAAAALDHQAQRQPHQRAERGLDGADIDRGERQKQEQPESSPMLARCRRRRRSLDEAGRAVRPPCAAELPTRAIRPIVARMMVVAKKVQEAMQRQNSHFGLIGVPAPRAWRRATPVAITMSPRIAPGASSCPLQCGKTARPLRGPSADSVRFKRRMRASLTSAIADLASAHARGDATSQAARPPSRTARPAPR